jgi:hypothetical protein
MRNFVFEFFPGGELWDHQGDENLCPSGEQSKGDGQQENQGSQRQCARGGRIAAVRAASEDAGAVLHVVARLPHIVAVVAQVEG